MAEFSPGSRSRAPIHWFGVGRLLCCGAFAGVPLARASDGDAVPVFSCAAQGKKYIELCAPSPITANGGFLEYWLGAQNPDGKDASEELRFPTHREGSIQRFCGATFTSKGTYTQSVRFKSGPATYTVFTASRGNATVPLLMF